MGLKEVVLLAGLALNGCATSTSASGELEQKDLLGCPNGSRYVAEGDRGACLESVFEDISDLQRKCAERAMRAGTAVDGYSKTLIWTCVPNLE